MPLLPVTQNLMALVERESGYPVRLVEETKLPAPARAQLASAATPAHVIAYRPAPDESADFLICHQCGFVLRLFDNPPNARFQLVSAEKGRREVRRLVTEAGSKLATRRPSGEPLEKKATALLDGVLSLLRSAPIGLRVGAWIYENYPELRAGQRAAVMSEVAAAAATLQPKLREATPVLVFDATQAMNAAYAMYWAEQDEMRDLAAPFREAGYKRAGRALLDEWYEAPDDPLHDRALVDRWAEELHIAGWGAWQRYVAP